MAEQEPLMSVDEIINRWPNIVDHDIEQVADFVEYYLTVPDEDYIDVLEEAEGQAADLLDYLARSVARRIQLKSERTREDILRETADAMFSLEQDEAMELVQSGNTELAEAAINTLFTKWPVEVEINYSPSPLIPDGRLRYIPIDLTNRRKPDAPYKSAYVVDCYGEKVELQYKLTEYINMREDLLSDEDDTEPIQALAESVLDFDAQKFEQLRHEYGTKAASLLMFDEAMTAFRSVADREYEAADISVPEFIAVPVRLYQMYKDTDEGYELYLEDIRQQAIIVSDDSYDPELHRPLVAIRSSAVFSEDGDEASGAGVYASLAADPRDPEAFKMAVEAVFDSLETEEAQTYLADKGIDDELMGLVIQRYIEGTQVHGKSRSAYGYIQSSDHSGRVMPLSSETGELVFDRKLVEKLFMTRSSVGNDQPTYHYVPDHDSAIAGFAQQGAHIANAALFAEKLFGKQVELEFAFNQSSTAYVLQVRPLPHQELPESIVFPTDIEPVLECRAIGVGDVVVTVRDEEDYQDGELRFSVVDTESQTGHTLWRSTDIVFLIEYNDGKSGHVQMLARERGQLCLYPDALVRLPTDTVNGLVSDPKQQRERKFRVVADGYRGAVYPFEEERVLVLRDIATSLSRYAVSRTINNGL